MKKFRILTVSSGALEEGTAESMERFLEYAKKKYGCTYNIRKNAFMSEQGALIVQEAQQYMASYYTDDEQNIGEFLEAGVFVEAYSVENAEIMADKKMKENDMSDWVLGAIFEIENKEAAIKGFKGKVIE